MAEVGRAGRGRSLFSLFCFGRRGRNAARLGLIVVLCLLSAAAIRSTDPVEAAGPLVVETRVQASDDDAEESAAGEVSLSSSDLELLRDGVREERVVGLRFRMVDVPARARIVHASVRFQVDETGADPTSLLIAGHASDDAPPFRDEPFDIGSRPRTTAAVAWAPPAWTTVGAAHPTPDLAPVLQEIVDRRGWSAGNAVALLITGSGHRVAEAFDGSPGAAPLLRVEYAPTVAVEVIDASVAEAADPTDGARLRLTRIGPVDRAIEVRYQVGGTATGGADYEAVPEQLSIAAGTTSADVIIRPIDDRAAEGTETVRLTVLDGSGYRAASNPTASVDIYDDETPLLTVGVAEGVAVEGADPPSDGAFLLTRAGPTERELTVRLAVAGDATPGVDYLPLPATVTFRAGSPNLPITVAPIDDSVSEPIEEVSLAVEPGGGYAVGDPTSAVIRIVDNDPVLDIAVADPADDAEERPTGRVNITRSDLEMVNDPRRGDQLVGLRFAVPVPPRARITAAWLQFVVDEPSDVGTRLIIRGEATDRPAPFAEVIHDLSRRPTTTASVPWTPAPWPDAGVAQRSPDLSIVVQEIVDRPDWTAESGLVLLISGTGQRVAAAFDDGPATAPILHLEYAGRGTPANTPPSVTARAESVVWPEKAALGGTVTDDLLPAPPGRLITTWTVVDGPGAVTFTDPSSIDTTATFSAPGIYELRLSADDGDASVSDTVLLTAVDPDDPEPGSVRFAAIGDYGTGCCEEADVATLVTGLDPDFVITVGDNRYGGDVDRAVGQYYSEFIGDYQGSYGPGAPLNRFFPAPGNHDYHESGGADVHFDYFTLPGDGIPTSGTSGNERYYDFIRGPVHFFVVNSNREEPDGRSSTSTQAQWLQTQLAASDTPWQVVYFHHPPYSSGSKHGPTEVMQWPFERWGADAVLAGHEHNYERLSKGSVPFFVVGNGGAGLYGRAPAPDADSEYFYDADHGALVVDASDHWLRFEFHSVSEGLLDTVTVG